MDSGPKIFKATHTYSATQLIEKLRAKTRDPSEPEPFVSLEEINSAYAKMYDAGFPGEALTALAEDINSELEKGLAAATIPGAPAVPEKIKISSTGNEALKRKLMLVGVVRTEVERPIIPVSREKLFEGGTEGDLKHLARISGCNIRVAGISQLHSLVVSLCAGVVRTQEDVKVAMTEGRVMKRVQKRNERWVYESFMGEDGESERDRIDGVASGADAEWLAALLAAPSPAKKVVRFESPIDERDESEADERVEAVRRLASELREHKRTNAAKGLETTLQAWLNGTESSEVLDGLLERAEEVLDAAKKEGGSAVLKRKAGETGEKKGGSDAKKLKADKHMVNKQKAEAKEKKAKALKKKKKSAKMAAGLSSDDSDHDSDMDISDIDEDEDESEDDDESAAEESDEDTGEMSEASRKLLIKAAGAPGQRRLASNTEGRAKLMAQDQLERDKTTMLITTAAFPDEWKTEVKVEQDQWEVLKRDELEKKYERRALREELEKLKDASSDPSHEKKKKSQLKKRMKLLGTLEVSAEVAGGAIQELWRQRRTALKQADKLGKDMVWATKYVKKFKKTMKASEDDSAETRKLILATDKEYLREQKMLRQKQQLTFQQTMVDKLESIGREGKKPMDRKPRNELEERTTSKKERRKTEGEITNWQFAPVELVDATVYSDKLAGMKAPKMGFGQKLNKPKLNEPIIHKDLDWGFVCTLCLKRGHNIMECGEVSAGLPAILQGRPAAEGTSRQGNQWRVSAEQAKIATPRYMFSEGIVNASGQKE